MHPLHVPILGDFLINPNERYITKARNKMRQLLRIQQTVSIDDVYRVCKPPIYINRNKIMRKIFNHPDFKRVATVQSKRAVAQRRYVGVYSLRDNPRLERS